jgi:DNA-binding CsgD family transcriptional regulator
MLTASSTAQRPVTVMLGRVMLGRFQAFTEPTARSDAPRNTPIPGLTPRENEVRGFLCAGYSYREIAATLYISPETVRTHCKRIYRKLGVSGRRELKASPAQGAPRSDEPQLDRVSPLCRPFVPRDPEDRAFFASTSPSGVTKITLFG